MSEQVKLHLKNKEMMIKIYHQYLRKSGVHAVFLITSRKHMSNNYVPSFNRIIFCY